MSLSRALATLSPLGLVRSGVFSLAPPTTSPSRGGYGRRSNLALFILYTSDWSLTGPRSATVKPRHLQESPPHLERIAAWRARGPPRAHVIHLARVPFVSSETRFYWCY